MNADRLAVRTSPCLLFLLLVVATLAIAPVRAATADEDKAQTVIHMLDYVSVDYPETVKNGAVQDEAEYKEQAEFAAQVLALLQQLPVVDGKEALLANAKTLIDRIAAKAPGAEVAGLARSLAGDVVQRYALTVTPKQPPDLARAAALFHANCVACHGAQGRGDGPAARGMDPLPSNFHDAARMDKRSIHGLYNTVTLGVNGTPMRGFGELSEADRWALAFYTSGLRHTPAQREQGKALWHRGTGKAELGDLRRLVTATPAEVSAGGRSDLDAVRAYLTAHPEALASAAPAPLAVAREKRAQALAA